MRNSRYKKISEFKDQQRKLAELESSRMEMMFAQAVLNLQELDAQFQKLSHEYENIVTQDVSSIEQVYLAIEDLGEKIATARRQVADCEQAWASSVEQTLQTKVEHEQFKTLHRADVKEQSERTAKRDANELQDTLMRHWYASQAGKDD